MVLSLLNVNLFMFYVRRFIHSASLNVDIVRDKKSNKVDRASRIDSFLYFSNPEL